MRLRAARHLHEPLINHEKAVQAAYHEATPGLHKLADAAGIVASTPAAALVVMAAAARAKVAVQHAEIAEAEEAQQAFTETIDALKARQSGELSKVVTETRVRREAQLQREIDRASSQLTEKLRMLSASQLLKVTEDLVDRVDRCRDDRKELEQLVNTKTILDKKGRRRPVGRLLEFNIGAAGDAQSSRRGDHGGRRACSRVGGCREAGGGDADAGGNA